MKLFLLLVIFSFFGEQSLHAQIYKWVDESGRTQFSDKPPPSTLDESNEPKPSSVLTTKTKPVKAYPETSITLKVRGLLEEKKFKELNTYLAKLQANVDSNIAAEDDLYTAYYTFRIEDKSYESLFNAWIDSTPNNYSAYLARARYYYGLGWMVRGTSWASETKKEKMKEMSDYLNKAMVDITAVFRITDRSLVSYTTLINIANTFGKDKEAEAAVRKALEIQPASYVVRTSYLNTLTPRWGGSYQKMAAFIKESLRFIKENPKIKWLGGEIYADTASMSSIRNAPNAAEEQYTKALSFGENHIILQKRAKVKFRLKKYKSALEDFNRAIAVYPEDADYYYWRGKTHVQGKNNSKAMADIQYAAKLKPNDEKINKLYEWLLLTEGYSLRNSVNKSSEIDKYNTALRLNPNNADTYYRRARAYIAQNKNDLAIKDLDKAIELDSNNIEHYVLIDFVLAKSREWKRIISYWDKFIALTPSSGRAYRERGGAYYRMGDMKSAVENAKRSADLGDLAGKEIYEKFRGRVGQ